MTELAVPEPNHSPAAVAMPQVVQSAPQLSLAAWAQEAEVAYQLATRLASTSFIPSTMRGNVGNITACLLAGQELGLPPIAALKSMDVIHGVPGLRAHAMRGLLQSHGHEIELIESTDTVCRMRGRRKGSENWQEVVWTIGRAELAGYVKKNAMYGTQPANMLIARATGEISRLVASDALHGVPYTAEELRDSAPTVTAVQVKPRVSAAEILGAPPVPQQPEETPAPAASESVPLTNWQIVWQDVVAGAQFLGWDRKRMEDEFAAKNDGLEVNDASVEDLTAFVEHLHSLAGEEQVA